ncbi:DUF4973 domain-containing protein [Sphingobacterium sp. Mn56C]|uniref:DUF4973 domain-containing protein n=1 Tax=Sphingobacterium sp. Mn56C TaxID=3395261 RepID=UPI003BDEA0F5
MKKIIFLSILSIGTLYCCNPMLDDELFEKTVVFTKNGFQDMLIDYNSQEETIAMLPVSISGTTRNTENVHVKVALDTDTLNNYNFERFRNQTNLYYNLLPEDSYALSAQDVIIPNGSERVMLPIKLKPAKIDKLKDFVLPLRISETSSYSIGPNKYSKALLRILFQNYFSGNYVVSGKVRDKTYNSEINLSSRTLKVVDENTCYFYAGNIDPNSNLDINNKFIIMLHVNPDTKIVSLFAADPAIELQPQTAKIETSINTDPQHNNTEITTLKITLKYTYKDITNTLSPPTMEFDGSMTLVKIKDTAKTE